MVNPMRLVEVFSGTGIISDAAGKKSISVRYCLELWQGEIDSETGYSIKGLTQIKGAVAPAPPLSVKPMILHLEDGRKLKCFVRDSEGTVQGTGGFLRS